VVLLLVFVLLLVMVLCIPFAPRIDKRWDWDDNGMIVNASVCDPQDIASGNTHAYNFIAFVLVFIV